MGEQRSGEGEPLKVVDKRRFNETEDTGQTSAADAKEEAAPKTEDSKEAKPESEAQRQEEQPDESNQFAPVDFANFIVSLATQSLVMLGQIPHPETNLMTVNMAAAKQTIDILLLLQEKTKGNLSAEEDRLLDEMLASLQMIFVKKLNESESA